MNGKRNIALEEIGDVDAFFDRARRDQVQCGFNAFAQVKWLDLNVHAPGFDLGEIENVVDDGQQRITRPTNGFHIVALFIVEFGVEQESAHADDGIHRRADLMAHGGQEGALGFVGLFGGGSRGSRFFEQTRILDRRGRG